eukprot:jgi/Chlat1/3254/Chrsp22S03432
MYSYGQAGAGYGARGAKYNDLEAGGSTLFPGLSEADSEMRWGFVRKVYGILSMQFLLTVIVSSIMVFSEPVNRLVTSNQAFLIVAMLLPFAVMIPLYCYRYHHPLNLVLLGLWTVAISLTVGVACSFVAGVVVLEALILTAAVVGGLTAYTFYAVKQGKDFNMLGPMLFASLWVLIAWGFIQFFFAPGPIGRMIYSLIGAIIFSAYIVYDTDNLIKRFSYDEYVWASVALYLDVINLFLRILEILQQMNNQQ